ncbi:Rid family hydrolase [Nonomuraea sp. NPDC050643]|uniref:Rid family hydrolase n=1 Tax=Nonomuraea sp. NPDC050643 TaxID=3155660 RepID=UPI0033F21956
MDPGRRSPQPGATGLEPALVGVRPHSSRTHHDQNRHHRRERPRLAGPLSQGIRKGPVLQVSGQFPLDPDTGEVVGATAAEQTAQTLRNVTAVLEAGGAGLEDVVMLRSTGG